MVLNGAKRTSQHSLVRRRITPDTDFKYDYSYEEIGLLFQKYVPSWRIEIEKVLYACTSFNYAFSNGDAHLKNFSLLETEFGDYTMSPAYDLVNTRLACR